MAPSGPNSTDVLSDDRPRPARLRLVVVSGEDAGKTLILERGTYRVGKHPGNDLVLRDSAASNVHLLVEVHDAGVRLIDNRSTNGSFVRGTRFTSLEGGPGMDLRIGRTDLRLLPAEMPLARLPVSQGTRFGDLVGQSIGMREVFGVLDRAAQSSSDLLIRGETGTGKELAARAVHAASDRSKGPFVVCDLTTVPADLVESEIFGHLKGAFTGATSDRAGAFERAHGGTLFLDEVGELPLETQTRLLRALERREVKRIGATDFRQVDVRVISATHRNLAEEVTARRFREDLYFRLAVISVALPPLRDRIEDTDLIVDAVLKRLGRPSSALTSSTRAMLKTYRWPGNVRELRNVVERAVCLGAEHAFGARADAEPARRERPFKEAKEAIVSSFERDYLADLMKRCEGNISQAAREADLDRVHLRKLLTKHGLTARGDRATRDAARKDGDEGDDGTT